MREELSHKKMVSFVEHLMANSMQVH